MSNTTADDVVAPENSQPLDLEQTSAPIPTSESTTDKPGPGREETQPGPEESGAVNLRWDLAFVCHKSQSINDSFFIWAREEINMARSFEITNDAIGDKLVTSEGNAKNKSMTELLQSFCQTIRLPISVPELVYNGVGVLFTVLCKQHQGNKFKNQDYPFSIRGFMPVDIEKQVKLLAKKCGNVPQPLYKFGDVGLHADEGMRESRGLVNYSIIGADGFSYVVIAKVDDPSWVDQFQKYPSPEFAAIIGISCYLFHHAVAYINNPINHLETAVLARQIGRAVYEECTQEITTRQVDEEPTVPSYTPRKPKKKNKSKKSKKTAKEAVEAEAGERETVVEDTIVPSTIGQPSEEELVVATETTTAPMASSSTQSPSPAASSMMPTIMTPVAFSFLSLDSRLICNLQGCTILANASYPSAVVCPRCTAYSFTRYCSRAHLFADLRGHFVSGECGSTLILGAVDDTDESALPASSLALRPYIQETREAITSIFAKNILERHRQALYRSMSRDTFVDYFIFDDIGQLHFLPDDVIRRMDPRVQRLYYQHVRGTGNVCATIELSDTDARKERLTDVIEGCLRLGMAAGAFRGRDCGWLFGLIKSELTRKREWDVEMEERVALQMGFEFGWRLPDGWRMAR